MLGLVRTACFLRAHDFCISYMLLISAQLGGRHIGRVVRGQRVQYAQVLPFDMIHGEREDSKDRQAWHKNITVRNFHATQPADSATILAVAFGIASTSYAASHAITVRFRRKDMNIV